MSWTPSTVSRLRRQKHAARFEAPPAIPYAEMRFPIGTDLDRKAQWDSHDNGPARKHKRPAGKSSNGVRRVTIFVVAATLGVPGMCHHLRGNEDRHAHGQQQDQSRNHGRNTDAVGRPADVGQRRHSSARTPLSFAIWAYLADSAAMNAANSAAVLPTASAPCSAIRWRTTGSSSAFTAAR